MQGLGGLHPEDAPLNADRAYSSLTTTLVSSTPTAPTLFSPRALRSCRSQGRKVLGCCETEAESEYEDGRAQGETILAQLH
jgi:hypothetical protein